ncbi:hypothetical protein [Agrobacterium sp. NPDC090283]|uniref:hypothetical protein n=1 Tax=Agrobacterium sp. NPDC090283 TaxID=3363920 RepID=UPI00383A4063
MPIGIADKAHSSDVSATQDAMIENWLRSEVAPAYDAYKADPTRAITLDEGMANVRARIAKGEGRE